MGRVLAKLLSLGWLHVRQRLALRIRCGVVTWRIGLGGGTLKRLVLLMNYIRMLALIRVRALVERLIGLRILRLLDWSHAKTCLT